MNKIEAMRALCDGKKVRQAEWAKGDFVTMNIVGRVTNNNGGSIDINKYSAYDWEIYEEPKPKVTYDDAMAARVVRIYWPCEGDIVSPAGTRIKGSWWAEAITKGSGWTGVELALFDFAERKGYRMEVVER
jgi:hypothetical protein